MNRCSPLGEVLLESIVWDVDAMSLRKLQILFPNITKRNVKVLLFSHLFSRLSEEGCGRPDRGWKVLSMEPWFVAAVHLVDEALLQPWCMGVNVFRVWIGAVIRQYTFCEWIRLRIRLLLWFTYPRITTKCSINCRQNPSLRSARYSLCQGSSCPLYS